MAVYDIQKNTFSRYYSIEANTQQEAIELVKRYPEYFYEETTDDTVYDVLTDEYHYGETFDEEGLEALHQELKKALSSEEYVKNCQAITAEMHERIKAKLQ